MRVILDHGKILDLDTMEERLATLSDLLDEVAEAYKSLESWSKILQWEIQQHEDLTSSIEGIKYWYGEIQRLQNLIWLSEYMEDDNDAGN